MVFPFINGLALVYDDNNFGFINTSGNVVIDFKYDSVPPAHPFRDGTAYVQKDGEWVTLPNLRHLLNRIKLPD